VDFEFNLPSSQTVALNINVCLNLFCLNAPLDSLSTRDNLRESVSFKKDIWIIGGGWVTRYEILTGDHIALP